MARGNVDLTSFLIGVSTGVNDDVAYDPAEVLNVLAFTSETMKLTPAWTATLTATSWKWGASAGALFWGKSNWS
jgi:hypothetical protein